MKIFKIILNYIDDVLIISGIIFLFKGCYMIYKPVGFIVLGLCSFAFAYIISKGLERR